jgi:tetratricopeptide (TPR) repeat protein
MATPKNVPGVNENLQNARRMESAGLFDKAISWYRKALRIQPDNIDIHIHTAIAALQCGESAIARSHFMRVLKLDSDNATAKAGIASVLEREGDYDEAYRHIAPLVRQAPSDMNVVITYSRICKQAKAYDEAIGLLEKLIAGNRIPEQQKHVLHFTLGDLHDACGHTAEAFAHYSIANAAKKASFDEWDHARNIARLIRTYSNEFMCRAPKSRKGTKHFRPIFIVGMPRAGTSLVEQILSSHPGVYGGGELTLIGSLVDSLPRLLHTNVTYPECMIDITQDAVNTLSREYSKRAGALIEGTASRVTDKLPGNVFHLGLIALIFPKAKVIHCTRHPLDTCLSCYFNDFSSPHMGFSYDLAKLGVYYRLYERLVEHWKNVVDIQIMDLKYEDLLDAPEQNIRALVEFCGLYWNHRCLSFYKNKRTVRTASYYQVRKPLYRSSIGRWKTYSDYIGPLKEALKRDLHVPV